MGTSSSPVPSNETGPTNGGTAPPSQNLRGINKPKCFQCGNVARSRCPYQSCKSCCAKAQNPCHIHGKIQWTAGFHSMEVKCRSYHEL